MDLKEIFDNVEEYVFAYCLAADALLVKPAILATRIRPCILVSSAEGLNVPSVYPDIIPASTILSIEPLAQCPSGTSLNV